MKHSAFLTLCLIILGGCSTARVTTPVTTAHGAATPEAQMDFWHALAEAPVTSNDDAFHGLLLSIDGASPDNYAARVEALKAKGLLPADYSAPADQAVTRGVLARAVTKHLKIRGGVMNTLTGSNTQRYTTRELVAEGILPPSSQNQTFSGAEFVGFLGAVEDYARGGPDAVAGSLAGPTPPAEEPPATESPASIQRQLP